MSTKDLFLCFHVNSPSFLPFPRILAGLLQDPVHTQPHISHLGLQSPGATADVWLVFVHTLFHMLSAVTCFILLLLVRCSSPNILPRKQIFVSFRFPLSCSFCHYPMMMMTTGGVWKVSGKVLQVLLGKSYFTSNAAQIQSSRLHSSFYPHSCSRPRYLRACSWGCTSNLQGASHCLRAQHRDLRPSAQRQIGPEWWPRKPTDPHRLQREEKLGLKYRQHRGHNRQGGNAWLSAETKHLFNRWKGEPGVWWWAAGLTRNSSTVQNKYFASGWRDTVSVKIDLHHNTLISFQ